jgi:PAS domain S-box-containing protein
MSVTMALALALLAEAAISASHAPGFKRPVLTDERKSLAIVGQILTPLPSETRRVVLLYDERLDFPGLAILDAALVQSLTSDGSGSVEVYREAMDLSRFGSDEYLRLMRDHLRAKYTAKKIDVVVAAMGPALAFLLGDGGRVFPGTPIVFCGIDRREIEGRALPRHVTGVLVKREFAPTLDIALRLHPGTSHVMFIGGTSEFDARLVEQARREFRPYEGRLTFTYQTALPLRELLAQVATLPPHTVILHSTIFRDGAGEAFIPHEVAERITAAATVPVYGFVDQFMGRGIVGGQLYSLKAHGEQAAGLVRRILAGEQPSDLPLLEGGASVHLFDWRQLQRWNISESLLPSSSTILFRQVSGWDQYRPQIVGAILLVGLQTALIGTLLFQRARRRRVETALLDSQQRYSLAAAAGAVGVWDWNFDTNQLFVDPGLKALLGFDDHEISDRPDDWGSRVHPQDLAVAVAGVQNCIDGITDTYEIEHRMVHKDGSVRWMLSRGSALRAANGTLRRLVGTKVDITERKLAEDAIRESQAVLDANHREIQSLAGRLLASQEVERARIARDLHDDLSQQIAGLAIALSALRRQVAGMPDAADLASNVSSVQQRAVALAQNVRDLSHDLHPSVLEHAGLVAALTAHCADIERHQRLAVTFRSEGDFKSTSADTALCLYRVAQEGLRNVVTHANAGRAEVLLSRAGDVAELSITDDGQGFDIAGVGKNGKGIGLVSISERVRLVGGTVSIMTELEKGTRLRVQVPANGHRLSARAVAPLSTSGTTTIKEPIAP